MSRLRYRDVKTKERELLALSSLTVEEFERLVPGFEQAFQAHMAQWCLDGKVRSKRRYSSYQNSPLPTAEDRLLFVMSYVKGNPLQSNHGTLFGMRQGKTNAWLHTLLPVLCETLRTLGGAPSRSVSALAEQFGIELRAESTALDTPVAPPPLFVMTAPSDGSSVPKMRLNKPLAIAARKKATP